MVHGLYNQTNIDNQDSGIKFLAVFCAMMIKSIDSKLLSLQTAIDCHFFFTNLLTNLDFDICMYYFNICGCKF